MSQHITKELEDLLQVEGNGVCADCGAPGAAALAGGEEEGGAVLHQPSQAVVRCLCGAPCFVCAGCGAGSGWTGAAATAATRRHGPPPASTAPHSCNARLPLTATGERGGHHGTPTPCSAHRHLARPVAAAVARGQLQASRAVSVRPPRPACPHPRPPPACPHTILWAGRSLSSSCHSSPPVPRLVDRLASSPPPTTPRTHTQRTHVHTHAPNTHPPTAMSAPTPLRNPFPHDLACSLSPSSRTRPRLDQRQPGHLPVHRL